MTRITRSIARILLLSTFVVSVLPGCKKLLDVQPQNRIAVASYDDIKALLGASLKSFQGWGTYEYIPVAQPFFHTKVFNEYLYTHLYADDYDPDRYINDETSSYGFDFLQSMKWDHRNAPGDIWRFYYENIGFYNMILNSLDKYPSADPVKNEQIAGEAKVIRAWYFFRLMQFFSPYHEEELGLPLNTDSDGISSYDGRRQTQQENYDFLIRELNEVLSYSGAAREGYNIFYNPRIVHALLAQIYLHKGGSGAGNPADYDKAIEHARVLLDGGLDYKTMRPVLPTASNGTEVFGLKTDRPYAALVCILSTNFYESLITGYFPHQYPSQSLYELFSDNDKRKSQNFGDPSDPYINRFLASFYYPYELFEFFTGAEMKLIVAESYARKGDDAAAEKELTEFAETRYTGYQRPTSESILQSILNERRREFCFDYSMRWLDLTRLQTGFTRTLTRVDGEKEVYTIVDGDYRFCMPIPNREERQENLIQQNPGWQ